jgi:hypothetical protein
VVAELGLVAGFGMLSPCAQAFALELQAFSVLPFQQTTDLVEKLRAQTSGSRANHARRNLRPAPLTLQSNPQR